MKYCSKCGNQLLDEATICMKCGCAVDKIDESIYAQNQENKGTVEIRKLDWLPLLFGIVALTDALFYGILIVGGVISNYTLGNIIYFLRYGLCVPVCGLFAILSAVFFMKSKRKVFPILGLVFGIIQIMLITIMLSV